MGLWGYGLAESELDRDRWQTCEELWECIIFTKMTLLPRIC